MSADFRSRARTMSIWLWLQGLTGIALVAAMSFLMFRADLVAILLILFIGVPTLLVSVLLIFDAWLFGVIARAPDELSGCRSVDEFLTGAGLKKRPATPRNLGSRIAGTRRLVYLQLLGVGLFAWAFLERTVSA